MNACTRTRDWLDDAVDGRLAPEARAAFDAHVRQCASCAAELEFATSLRASLLRVGFDPAPSGLRESIAAEIGQLDREPRQAAAPASASPPRTASWLRQPWMRAAAAVLVLVTIAWFGFRPRQAPPVAGRTDAAIRETEQEKEREKVVAAGDRAPVVRMITSDPAGSTSSSLAPSRGVAEGLARSRPEANGAAWIRVRTIAAAGAAAIDDLNRVLGEGATPEHRIRQAKMLTMLDDSLPALAEAVGESSALSDLTDDADRALGVFAAAEKKEDAGSDLESALKVAPQRPASRADADDVQAADAGDPALYVVTGAGVIGRVERLLDERQIERREITLKNEDANARKRKLEREESGYRIVEADVAATALNDLIGDIESLDGIRLAPVGKAPASPAPAASLARGGSKDGAPAAGAADRSVAPKQPSIRKLRLILIGR